MNSEDHKTEGAPFNEGDKEGRILEILREAKKLGQEYRALTGKPLGITGEVAEYEAARLLGVELTPARQAGYDAIEHGAGAPRRLQIKVVVFSKYVPFGLRDLK